MESFMKSYRDISDFIDLTLRQAMQKAELKDVPKLSRIDSFGHPYYEECDTEGICYRWTDTDFGEGKPVIVLEVSINVMIKGKTERFSLSRNVCLNQEG